MADTIEIIQGTATTIEIAGLQGPQGPQGATGSGLGTLTTQGDTLYQGASAAQRLPIGTAGQILKVAASGIPEWGAAPASGVSSVNTLTGDVVLEAADVDAAADVVPAAYVLASTDPAYAPISGYYYRSDTAVGGKSAYYKIGTRENTSITYSSATTEWQIKHNATIVVVSNDNPVPNDPWDVADWEPIGSDPFVYVSQADTVLFINATAQKASGVTTASDISAVPTSRTITAGTGLTGGGDLTANRTLAVSYGTSAGTACEGNDARLSDSRAPTAHTHPTSDITSGTLLHERGGLEADVSAYNGLVKIASGSTSAVTVTSAGEALLDDADASAQRTTLGLGNSATLNTGTTAGTVAAGDHTHTQLHDRSHAITSASDHTAGNNKIFYSDNTGAITELALGANGTVLTSSGATSAPTFSTPAASGVTAVGASTADVLSVSGSDLIADDPNADRIVFWDDSEGKWRYLEAGSGLSISGTTMTATGTIGGGTGSTDNAILRADGTSGSQSQASDIVIDDYAAATQGGTTIATRSVSFSCTATASDDFVTASGHTFANGDQVVFTALTGGSGLSTNTRYFVRDSETNKFKLATTSTGSAINITTDATAGTIQLVTALCLNPRNIGAFILGPKPDGTAVGGNARGRNAVDLQTYRADANDAAAVASGNYSVLAGNNSRTSAERSSAFGAWNTTVSGFGATSLGNFDSTINGTFAVGIGQGVNTSSRYGIVAFGHQYFNSQVILAQMTGRTTTNSAVELSAEGTATTTRLTIPSGRIHHYFIIITGVRSTGATSAHYMRQYAIKNVGGTTSEVFAPVTIGTDTAASTSISITADDTNDSLKIDCTGIASETWRWHALIWCSEYAYGT